MAVIPILLSLSFAGSGMTVPTVNLVAPARSGEATPSDAPPPEAVEAFYRARELYADAAYEEALAAFLEADRLHPAPDLQYNIGMCHMRLEHWEEAIKAFEIYLRTKENPPDRADVEARIAEAKRRLEQEKETPPPPPEDEPTQQPQPITDEPPPTGKPHRPFIISGAVLLGLGAAGAIGGASGIGFVINEKNDELDEIVNGGNPRDVGYARAVQTEEDAKRLVTYQWMSVGIGAGVAVVGAVLLGVGLKRRADARKGNTAWLPWGGRGSAGFAVRGTF
jgi:hypothetical protein